MRQRRARAGALARGPERLHREEARGFGAIVLSTRNLTNWPEAGRIRGIPHYVLIRARKCSGDLKVACAALLTRSSVARTDNDSTDARTSSVYSVLIGSVQESANGAVAVGLTVLCTSRPAYYCPARGCTGRTASLSLSLWLPVLRVQLVTIDGSASGRDGTGRTGPGAHTRR